MPPDGGVAYTAIDFIGLRTRGLTMATTHSHQRAALRDSLAPLHKEHRLVCAAVTLLRGDLALLRTERRSILVAAEGIDGAEAARHLADPVTAMALGYRSQISVPLWHDGLRVGVFAVLDRSLRHFQEADVALLRAFAGQVERNFVTLH